MRKLRLTLLTAFVFTIFYGCSKNNNKNNSSPTSTQWTYNDTTYFGVSTFYDTTGRLLILESEDAKGNKIMLQFNSRPTENSTYKAVENVFDSVSTKPYVSIFIFLNSAPSTNYELCLIWKGSGDIVNTTSSSMANYMLCFPTLLFQILLTTVNFRNDHTDGILIYQFSFFQATIRGFPNQTNLFPQNSFCTSRI